MLPDVLIAEEENQTVLEEIARTEESLRKKTRDLTGLMAHPTSSLGSILEAKRDIVELNAYLKGLKFCAADMPGSSEF